MLRAAKPGAIFGKQFSKRHKPDSLKDAAPKDCSNHHERLFLAYTVSHIFAQTDRKQAEQLENCIYLREQTAPHERNSLTRVAVVTKSKAASVQNKRAPVTFETIGKEAQKRRWDIVKRLKRHSVARTGSKNGLLKRPTYSKLQIVPLLKSENCFLRISTEHLFYLQF